MNVWRESSPASAPPVFTHLHREIANEKPTWARVQRAPILHRTPRARTRRDELQPSQLRTLFVHTCRGRVCAPGKNTALDGRATGAARSAENSRTVVCRFGRISRIAIGLHPKPNTPTRGRPRLEVASNTRCVQASGLPSLGRMMISPSPLARPRDGATTVSVTRQLGGARGLVRTILGEKRELPPRRWSRLRTSWNGRGWARGGGGGTALVGALCGGRGWRAGRADGGRSCARTSNWHLRVTVRMTCRGFPSPPHPRTLSPPSRSTPTHPPHTHTRTFDTTCSPKLIFAAHRCSLQASLRTQQSVDKLPTFEKMAAARQGEDHDMHLKVSESLLVQYT